MKKLLMSLMLCAAVMLVPSCGGESGGKTAEGYGSPTSEVSNSDYKEMKKHPEDYTQSELKKAGLDPSQGKPDGEGAAPAEGAAAPAQQ